MTSTDTPLPVSQKAMWQGDSGRAWVEAQDLLDGLFAPIEAHLVRIAAEAAPEALIDVGCGTGATTLAMARATGARGVGLDISEPMLGLARSRAEASGLDVSFITGDAQREPLESGAFDLLASRFGVMFFDDPAAAFANLRTAARAGAGLHFVAWRGPAENDFMTAGERAAAPLLPPAPMRKGDEPGPFGLASADRTARLLREAGWGGIEIDPIDFTCVMPRDRLEDYYTRVGPVVKPLATSEPAFREKLKAAVEEGFAPFVDGDAVRFPAACWTIRARNG